MTSYYHHGSVVVEVDDMPDTDDIPTTVNVNGRAVDIEYFTVEPDGRHAFKVLAWFTYPNTSVLEGTPGKQYMDSFETVAEAKAAYPTATESSPFCHPTMGLPRNPPADFDPLDAGEAWSEDDW